MSFAVALSKGVINIPKAKGGIKNKYKSEDRDNVNTVSSKHVSYG